MMLAIFHRPDHDGQCSGAILKESYPDIKLVGLDHGDEFPWDLIKKGMTVFMTDFSLPMDQMIKLNQMCDFHWVDHHQSAISDAIRVNFNPKGLRNTIKSGCELTWEYINPEKDMPLSVFLFGRFDTWKHDDDDRTLPFEYGAKIEDLDPSDGKNDDLWKLLLNDDQETIDLFISQGGIALKFMMQHFKAWSKSHTYEIEFEGYRCLVANYLRSNSFLFDSVYNPDKHDVMISFGFNGKFWKVSLYAKKSNVDVSLIAKKYKGGGHKGASGFEIEVLPKEFKIKG